jgi:hypothetical protein
MTRHSDLDLSGLNLYNENGGVVQGQICGQAFVTKLLRKKGSKGGGGLNKELSLAFQKDANAICMSPMGRPKKIKFHKQNLYENMNNMSSIDTESCTSDDIFSDSSGPGVNAAADDLDTPAFVAQFDPALELVSKSNSPDQHLRQHQQKQQQQKLQQNNAKRGSIPWSASLPAVVEEDSQSEQSSQNLGIWRNNNSNNKSPETENVAVLSIIAHKEQILKEKGDPNETMDLLESDRIGSPRAIPIALASPPSIPHSRPLEYRDNESQSESQDIDIESKPSNPKKQHIRERERETKRSKEDCMREAVDRRIRQAMEDAIHSAQSEDASDVRRLESIDSELISADSSMRSPTATTHHHKAPFDPFHHQGNINQMGIMPPRFNHPPRQAPESFLPKGYQLNQMAGNNEVSTAMQELLLQQQMTLKEMSIQNSHYQQELQECQEIFGKWRLEREKQRSTIQDLVKEKEAYATEASFLRNEMSSIRQELEALRKETRMQATVTMQSPPKQPHPQRHPQKQSSYHLEDKSPSPFQGFRHKQPHQESPSFNDSPPVLSKTNLHPDHRQSPPPESPSENAGSPPSSALGLRLPVFSTPPPPPPPEPRTPNSNSKRNSIGTNNKNKPDNHMMSSPSHHAQHSNQKEKSLMSGLKQPNSDSAKKKRSVKFHDPPMNQKWTLFPNHLHDDRLLEQSYQDSSKQSETRDEMESQTDYNNVNNRGEDDMALNVHVPEEEEEEEEEEPCESVDAPTPIAANGRRLSTGSNSNAGGGSSQHADPNAAGTVTIPSAAYKYRLETMKQSRQQRTGRHSSGSPAPRNSPGLGSPERKRRGRSRPPSGGHR